MRSPPCHTFAPRLLGTGGQPPLVNSLPLPPQAASPACTELETVMMDWLGKMLELPEAFLAGRAGEGGGVIQVWAGSTEALAAGAEP